MTEARPEIDAWNEMVEGLRAAGERLAADTAGLDPMERADGVRALLRALNNQLARFEVDRDRPELVPFNGWREKFLMDNPDFRYWVADIRDDRRYRITGNRGDASYVSLTAYAGSGAVDAAATARLDSDSLTFGADGSFSVTVARQRPADTTDDWLPLPEGATAVWVRHFHTDVRHDQHGHCAIEPLDPPAPPPPIDPDRFAKHLRRLGSAMPFIASTFAGAARAEAPTPNQVRHWSEMAGGAVYTEPGIHYLRGSWVLEPGQALLIEGAAPPCRYWNVLLYSRFLNSLDHRWRPVSRTGATASLADGRYRFALAAEDPGVPGLDWLDTEGRPFGIVVLRFLQPESEPATPTATVAPLADLRNR